MMHNWWIATLEYFGLITREEAEHIAMEIKSSIHKDNYRENFQELTAILNTPRLKELPILKKLQNDFADIKRDVGVMRLADPAKAIEELKARVEVLENSRKPAPTGINKTVANATQT